MQSRTNVKACTQLEISLVGSGKIVKRRMQLACHRSTTLVVGFFSTIIVILLFLLSVSMHSQQGTTVPLIEALRDRDLDHARKLLHSGVRLNVRDGSGDTPLLQAIRSHFSEFTEELLRAGADPNFTSGGGDTPLMSAAWNCDLKIARELLNRRASVNAANAQGENALMRASQSCYDGNMVQFLLDAGANPNARTSRGNTALMNAAGNELAAIELLKADADPTIKNKNGKTIEDEACGRGERGHTRVCALVRNALRKLTSTH